MAGQLPSGGIEDSVIFASKGPEMLEDVLSELIDRRCESRGLDYKGPMEFGDSKTEQGALMKDLMAFANTQDGGYIVVGVAENS